MQHRTEIGDLPLNFCFIMTSTLSPDAKEKDKGALFLQAVRDGNKDLANKYLKSSTMNYKDGTTKQAKGECAILNFLDATPLCSN